MNEAKTQTSKKNVEVSSLKSMAIFLEGVKQGRGGNLLPLGNRSYGTQAFLDAPSAEILEHYTRC